MDRLREQERLEQTERNVSEVKRHVARLREVVAELQREGNDIRLAMNLLQQFEQRLAVHIGERDGLRKELGLPAGGVSCPVRRPGGGLSIVA
jgi:hypothetical protein